MTLALMELEAEGWLLTPELLAAFSPFRTHHLNRFGLVRAERRHAGAGGFNAACRPPRPSGIRRRRCWAVWNRTTPEASRRQACGRVLKRFFAQVSDVAQEHSPATAEKLRRASPHGRAIRTPPMHSSAAWISPLWETTRVTPRCRPLRSTCTPTRRSGLGNSERHSREAGADPSHPLRRKKSCL